MATHGLPRPFGPRLRAIRRERGIGPNDVIYALKNRGIQRVSTSWLAKVEQLGGDAAYGIYPSDEKIVALAEILDATSEELPEADLARARRLLDEREIGLEAALRNLRRAQLPTSRLGAGTSPPARQELADTVEATSTPPGRTRKSRGKASQESG